MYKTILFASFIVFLKCSPQSNTVNTKKEIKKIECTSTQRAFGDIFICMPEVQNYTECFENKFVAERVNEEMGLLNDEIIGVYLPNEVFSKFQKEPYKIFLSEFVKVYGNPPLKNKKVPESFFEQIENKLRADSEVVPWDNVVKSINQGKIGFTMEKPALIEIYQSDKNIKSIIYIADYTYQDKTEKLLWTANMCIIKERLIYFAYYLKLDGSETKDLLKKKSEAFGKELMRLNS